MHIVKKLSAEHEEFISALVPEVWGAGGACLFGKSSVICYAKSLQSCLTLCDPIDGSPPGYPVPGILQARTLEWVAISFSSPNGRGPHLEVFLAWRIPGTGEPGGLPSMGSHRVGHD